MQKSSQPKLKDSDFHPSWLWLAEIGRRLMETMTQRPMFASRPALRSHDVFFPTVFKLEWGQRRFQRSQFTADVWSRIVHFKKCGCSLRCTASSSSLRVVSRLMQSQTELCRFCISITSVSESFSVCWWKHNVSWLCFFVIEYFE